MLVISLEDLISPVIATAHIAAKTILDIYQQDNIFTEKKADKSPVTIADIRSHEIICESLHELTPNIPIISEEEKIPPYSERKNWDYYWLIDPLDGTKEFINKRDDFAINIALIKQHKPVLGVVYLPVAKHCYYAFEGSGAFKKTNSLAEKIQVAKTVRLPIKIAASFWHDREKLKKRLQGFPDFEIIHRGSALKLCLIADGSVDAYPRVGPTSEWDTAAAHCIITEAGGFLQDFKFQELQYNQKDSLLNPSFIAYGDKAFPWSKYIG